MPLHASARQINELFLTEHLVQIQRSHTGGGSNGEEMFDEACRALNDFLGVMSDEIEFGGDRSLLRLENNDALAYTEA